MTKRPASVPGPSRSKTPPLPSTGRTNTLGMTSVELEAIYEQLDSGTGDSSHRRQSSRLSFRQPSVGVEIIQPGGGQTQITVACRNLSRTGLGFLHSSYVHIGTRVVLTLTHHTELRVRVAAKVMRCRHVTRTVHEVGVMFDEPINVRDFMELDPLNQTFTCEVVDPAKLKGTLLVVAEYQLEQACVQSMLRDTALEFQGASSMEQGLELSRKGVSVILCDDLFENGSGAEFVVAARKAGVRSPIILMSADTSEQGRDRIRKAAADAFLAKPLSDKLLLQAVAEFLLMSGENAESATPLYTALPPTSPMLDLADSLVDDLKTIADQVEKLAKAADIPGIRRQCLRIGGPATSLGFEPIAKLAGQLTSALEATKSVEQSVVALNTFVAACRGARKAERVKEEPAKDEPGAQPLAAAA